MKCKVCGNESGNYPLCRACNLKKEKGEIVKCNKCGQWHYVDSPCSTEAELSPNSFLYDLKPTLLSKTEQNFFTAIKESIPEGYLVFPQVNLASFIEKTDNSRFHNELFRIVDFLITDLQYKPKAVIEINDSTHMETHRKERDEKVQNICEEAGIPIIRFWTSYGVNKEYISKKLSEALSDKEIQRIHHFTLKQPESETTDTAQPSNTQNKNQKTEKKKGCYIATCVYGSYDCAPVWVLRRFRDDFLSQNIFGRLFIFLYYLISPTIVRMFGQRNWFVMPTKTVLDSFVSYLEKKGFSHDFYNDTKY